MFLVSPLLPLPFSLHGSYYTAQAGRKLDICLPHSIPARMADMCYWLPAMFSRPKKASEHTPTLGLSCAPCSSVESLSETWLQSLTLAVPFLCWSAFILARELPGFHVVTAVGPRQHGVLAGDHQNLVIPTRCACGSSGMLL